MKRVLTLTLLALAASGANAQTFKAQRKPLTGVDAFRNHMLLKATRTSGTAQKPTVMQQRVIAEVGFNVNGQVLTKADTTLFRYSGGRGSKFDYNDLYHDYYFPGSDDPSLDALGFGNINVKADTVRYYSGATLALEEEMLATYTTSNKLLDYSYNDIPNSRISRVVADYDAQGRMEVLTGFSWNAIAIQWDSISRRVLSYNAQNEVVSDTVFAYDQGEWLPFQAYFYTYNSANNLVSGSAKWDMTLSGVFTDLYSMTLDYYPNNTLKEFQVDVNLSGTGLEPLQRDSFAHDPLDTYYTFEQIWSYDNVNTAWVPSQRTIRNVNAAGLPDSSLLYNWDQAGDSFNLNTIVTTSYNSYSNPTKMESYANTGSGLNNVYRYLFYYEDFDPTSVKNIASAEENMKVYPNPANDRVNLNWEADGKQVYLNIVNAAGQMVYSEALTRVRENEQIAVGNLAPGMYWLTVKAANGALLYKTSLIKQ